jgi:hypothetical protein
METKIEHKYRVGDVFLISDGWGEILLAPDMGCTEQIFTYAYINTKTLAISHKYFGSITSVEKHYNYPEKNAKFLFNLSDLFATTRDALNEDTNT